MRAEDIAGVDYSTALRLFGVAVSIAPCLPSLEGEGKLIAIAILQGVAAELPASGERRIRSQSRNGTSITLADISSAFTSDDRDALRALCPSAGAAAASPVGCFPPAGMVEILWPEQSP